MPDMRIRRAAPADLPVLTRLWQAAFGDPPELIERFYRRFPPAKAAWVVEAGGCVVTAAHLLEGRLHTADGGVLPCAYVYAVSTDPAHQGNGYASALMRRFAMDADVSGRVLLIQVVSGSHGHNTDRPRRADTHCPAANSRHFAECHPHQRAGIRCTSGAAAAGANLRRAVSSAAGFSSRSVRHVRRRFGARRLRMRRRGTRWRHADHQGTAGCRHRICGAGAARSL